MPLHPEESPRHIPIQFCFAHNETTLPRQPELETASTFEPHGHPHSMPTSLQSGPFFAPGSIENGAALPQFATGTEQISDPFSSNIPPGSESGYALLQASDLGDPDPINAHIGVENFGFHLEHEHQLPELYPPFGLGTPQSPTLIGNPRHSE